ISTGGTEVPQTLALWDSKPFTPPSTVTLAYDTKSAALAAPLGSGGDLDDDWVVARGDTKTLMPGLGYTTTVDPHNDGEMSLGDVKGKQVVTMNASTSGLNADYLAATLQCGGLADSARDAIYSFTHSTGGKVRVSVNNPNPAFVPTLALFKGSPTTAAGVNPVESALPTNNEDRASAAALGAIGVPHVYTGSTATFTNSQSGDTFKQGSAYGSSVCTPDVAGKDAFVSFTLTGTKTVELSTVSSSFDHTIALWDDSPVTPPAALAMSNDTRSAAYSNSIGAIDDRWVVKSAAMTALMPGALTAASPTVAHNDDIQDLGNPVSKRISVAGDTSGAAVHGDYAQSTLTCGNAGSDAAKDIIYKLRPTANTTVRIATHNPTNPTFTNALALFNGASGDPQKISDSVATNTTNYCGAGYSYTPSNLNVAGFSFTGAPTVTLGCGTSGTPVTVTFNSTTRVFDAAWCAGQTKPTIVTQVQSDGSEVVVLPFAAFTLNQYTTLRLVGTRPVVLAVQGAASIAGTIDASASAGTPGAGGNTGCTAAQSGADGTGFSSLNGSGAGGGGYNTGGGPGGKSGISAGGVGGNTTRGNGLLVPLLGGCPGGTGHNGPSAVGAGGGAVQVSVGTTLAVTSTGSIRADGGVAPATTANDGGGNGGGSGGAVLLEGSTVVVSGNVSIKGGAGGDGQGLFGGNGGTGSSGSSGGTGADSSVNGGGGGGGGYGRTLTNQTPCAPPNDTFATAQSVPVGQDQIYNGPIGAMGNNTVGSQFAAAGCTPDTSTGGNARDAFFTFTLTSSTRMQIASASSTFAHTLALFNSTTGTAITCQDGAATTGASITQTLAAGTYYVGIKGKAAASGNFKVAIKDVGSAPPYASTLACTTTDTLDAALTANTDYYVVVKGASAGLQGTYNLTVTDIGAVPDFGCGNDQSAPDAYFDFEVTAPGGRTVTIALNEDGTHLNGSFQLVQDGGVLNNLAGDVPFACEYASQQYTLAPGRYYVVVRGISVLSNAGTKPLELSIVDNSGANALDCADGSAVGAATLTRTLAAGTYYVGITSRATGSAGGSYKLRVRDTSIPVGGGGTWLGCGNSDYSIDYDIPVGDRNTPHFVVVKGTAAADEGAYTVTVTDLNSVTDTCAAGDPIQMDPSAADAYYAFKISDTAADGQDVTVALAATSALDGAYRLFHSNGTPVGDCHDRTAPFTYADLTPDTYYVALRSKSVGAGAGDRPYELSIQDQDAYGSIDCKDGAAITGTTITRALTPGTYWVGIKPTLGAPTSLQKYSVQFRDTAEVTAPGASEIGCAPEVISASVKKNQPYYVLVKGTSATDQGAYRLTVTDVLSSGGFNCGDDVGSGDAYFEFSVNDPGGRKVTIDTEGSQLDTVLALFPAGAAIDATGKLQCDDNGGATAGSSMITLDLAPGVYYAVVRARDGAANPNLPFEFSIRDESALGSIACSTTSQGKSAQIRAQLGPGTYHAVLKGMPGSDKGAYKLRFRDEGLYDNSASEVACNDAQNEILYSVTAGKPYYAVVKGAAANQAGAYKLTVENLTAQVGMGCNASQVAPDAVYRFHLSADTRVEINTIGSQTTGSSPTPTDTVIAIYDTSASYFGTNYAENKNNVPVNCDDDGAGANGWSRIIADLKGNRDYYVVIKSKASAWGSGSKLPYLVNIRDVNANRPIACSDVNASFQMTQSLPAGDYRVVVSNSTGASGGGAFELNLRNLSVANNGAQRLPCSATPNELTYNLTAGRPYYLVMKGDDAADRGQYGLVVETVGSGATSMGCNANPAAPDAFFKFNVAKQGPVVIDTDGSTADTVVALYPATTAIFSNNYALDAFGNSVGCDDDSGATTGASRLSATLAPGDYYLVVKGKTVGWGTAAQPFNVSIRDASTTGTIACANAAVGGGKIQQTLEAGDYNLVLSTQSAAGGQYAVKFRDTARTGTENGTKLACGAGKITAKGLQAGRTYYIVVKGDTNSEAGAYNLVLEDTVSQAGLSGSTSIACAAEDSAIDGVYPAGTYYALVTGKSSSANGPYTLRASDVAAFVDQNRVACDDDTGPNKTSVIERQLTAGTHYVVVKGKNAEQKGAYNLHIRDADAVPSNVLACGGAETAEHLEYDVVAGQDYTVLLKGNATGANGTYNVKMYDQDGLQSNNGQRLTCVSDVQPTTLYKSDWHTKKVDFSLNLTPDTYYVSVKGAKAADKGSYQLQIGELGARTMTTYTPPTWTELKDALEISEARILPVVATGSDTSNWADNAEAQAKVIATSSHAVGAGGAPIWTKIQRDGRGTGSGLITGIAQVADYLAMDVAVVATDGPDPGASRFRINVAPVNTPQCLSPHPLIDGSTHVCTPKPGNPKGYACNTQYACAPGSAPKFVVTITNPTDAPVAPNANDAFGGYHFKLQIIGNKKYLLDEVPVYIIPTTAMTNVPGPGGGSGAFQSSGTYTQDISAAGCSKTIGDNSNELPKWSDLFFNANLPEGTSIDFQLCTGNSDSELNACTWVSPRKKVTVRAKGTCADNTQCLNIPGYGNGFCGGGQCQFITEPKVAYDVSCSNDTQCPNGPLGAGDYYISSRCETTRGAVGYGHCVYTSQPVDIAATLLSTEQGRSLGRVKVTLHSDSTGTVAPTLYQWNLRYYCQAAQ
ncbi:MAG: hypothetical protein RL701_5430, partial [Pseudomonadota bacterium]